MKINTTIKGNDIYIELEGRLDTITSPQLETECKKIGEATSLILDFKRLEYVSSAGLRIILAAQKVMNKQGKMIIKNVCDNIMEVFEITGFSDILTIER